MKKEINLIVISNITFEPYFTRCINNIFQTINTNVNTIFVPYEEYFIIETERFRCDYVCICLNFDCLFYAQNMDTLLSKTSSVRLYEEVELAYFTMYNYIKSRLNSPVLWFGFEDYYHTQPFFLGHTIICDGMVDNMNIRLYGLLEPLDTFIDLKRIIAQVGIQHAYNPKGKYRWNAPYSKELTELMCQEICKQYLIHNGQTKKCIVLDCDNVLWGGILSEDGIEKIQLGSGLGQSYQDFQRFLLTLYYHGVILTICSKNDEADVLRVFREHSGMVLKEEHIACFKVNWNNKPDNIREIADELEIGLDSMVFIDDSEFEIHSVETMVPEVIAVQYERDSVYGKLSCFNLKSHIDIQQVQKRNQTYRANVSRQKIKLQSASYDEYISALEMKIDIHKALSTELARISELSQRTNKCTNGTRYTVEKLQEQLCTGTYKLYAVYVSDKFSNLGLVGAIGIQKNEVDLFSLSCRALGRSVEEQMLEFIKKQQVSKFSFVTTHKNRDLYNKIKTF